MGMLAVRHHPTSAAVVRHSIADDLSAHAVNAECIDDVVLVASELVGNAVLHTAASFADELDVRWEIEEDAVVVQVGDGGDDPPRPRSTTAREPGGRGLAIVAALARDWGVRCNPTGKQVWARVPMAHSHS